MAQRKKHCFKGYIADIPTVITIEYFRKKNPDSRFRRDRE